MNVKTFALLLTLGFAPVLVAAQTSNPPPCAPSATPAAAPMRMSPQLMQEHMAAFRRFHQQAETIHRATRAKMLAALTPAHRAFVGRVLGLLAVATTPNQRAAVQRVDAVLTASEKDAILAAQRSEMEQMHAQMQQMRTQMQQMRAQMQSQMGTARGTVTTMHAGEMGEHRHAHHAPDAGAALLRGLLPGHAQMMGMMMMHRRGPR